MINRSVKEMAALLNYGEKKYLAKRFGIKYHRAKNLLAGRLKPKESDHGFIMACFDLALPRKTMATKLKTFVQ